LCVNYVVRIFQLLHSFLKKWNKCRCRKGSKHMFSAQL